MEVEYASPSIYRLGSLEEKPIALIARHPGPAKYVGDIGQALYEQGSPLLMIATERGEEILGKMFPERQRVDVGVFPAVDLAIVSSDIPMTFERDQLRDLRESNPGLKIVAGEALTRDLKLMEQLLTDPETIPDLLFTTTRAQVDRYRTEYPLLKKALIIPVGQPSFDRLLREDLAERASEAREKLGIKENELAVTFIGSASEDTSNLKAEFKEGNDLNTLTLQATMDQLIPLAKEHADENIVFIYRPHPREPKDQWIHPALTRQFPKNLRIIAHTKEKWQEIGLDSGSICFASEATVAMVSTLSQEAALAAGIMEGKKAPIPIDVLLPQAEPNAFAAESLPSVEVEASVLAKSAEEIGEYMEKALFDLTFRQKVHQAQTTKLRQEYRHKTSAAHRATLWIRALERRGKERLIAWLPRRNR